MKGFSGFPSKMSQTPLPDLFFSSLLPQIQDVAELKLLLHVFWVLKGRKGYPRFVTHRELLADRALTSGLAQQEGGSTKALARGLALAVQRGTLLQLNLEKDGRREELFFLNTPSDKEAIRKIESGGISLGALPLEEASPLEERPSIFKLYEENIGVITPMIAEELREAEKQYPASWIEEAIRLAVNDNVRRWHYIAAILERWATDGRDDGEPRRYSKEEGPEKYFKGRYGHIVKGKPSRRVGS